MASFPLSSSNGLYSYETIAHLADDLLSKSDQNRSHALFLVDHDTLDNINKAFGRDVGDAVIQHTTETLPTVFRATDLVARTYDDDIIAGMHQDDRRRVRDELAEALETNSSLKTIALARFGGGE
ncbi:MAG TPA: diguanylate cyclase [Candidatus Aphodovivens excrementavium]|nr:diguanylate cyclase [Candidatus Aphodovivens excrementavium]